jgi:hypothetical protein
VLLHNQKPKAAAKYGARDDAAAPANFSVKYIGAQI